MFSSQIIVDDLDYDSLLLNFIQFNISNQQQPQNLDLILNTCQNLCKSLNLNKNFGEFLKKFNILTQNLDEFSCLNKQHKNTLLENVECLFKLYNCSILIINHLNIATNDVILNYLQNIILFLINILNLIQKIYLLINNQQQQKNQTLSSTQCTQNSLTQIVRDSFNNNSTLQNTVKLQHELINESCKLIDLISNQANNNFNFKNDIIKLSDCLILIIKSIKSDTKLTISLWKCFYTFIKKNRKCFEQTINLNECLGALNDEINISLNYLKTNNTMDNNDISSLNKIIKISILLLKLFKSIIEIFAVNASNVNEKLVDLLVNLIVDLTNISHATSLVLKDVRNDILCEFKPVINFLRDFLFTNYQLDFINSIIRFNRNDAIFLLNYLSSTHFKDLSIITKLFKTLNNTSSVDIYLPNYYFYDDYEIEFSLYLQICLSSHVKQTVKTKEMSLIMNLINFFLYNQLHGTLIQSQFSMDCLIYLSKLVGVDFRINLIKYYFNIYEQTQNLFIKCLITNNLQQHTSVNSQIYDFVIKKQPSMQYSQSLLFSLLAHSPPQIRQTHQTYLTKYILNIQTQLIDHINQIFNERQVVNSILIKKIILNIKHTQIILEFCPQSMQNEQKFKEIYVNLIKLLKSFNINKLKVTFSLIIKFLCEIIYLLKLFNSHFKQLNQILNNKLILFILNFMQQLNISIETTSSMQLSANNGNYLKILKFYSIDYIQSLAKISSFDSLENNNIASNYCLIDDDEQQYDDNGQIISNEKMIINKLVTFFCYLLNDSNQIINELALECIDDYRKNSKYFDYLLPEIIRSNKLKMQELVGNYMRKIPKKCNSNETEILNNRLTTIGDSDVDEDVLFENIEIVNKFENDASKMIELFLKLNKPLWFKNKIENIVKILNEST
jgi:hypothetical protein